MELAEYSKMYQMEGKNWWYTGRNELIFKIIAKSNKYFKYFPERDSKILDAGCGTGIHLKGLQNQGYTYGLDISWDALRFCQSRGLQNLICGSADKLPFKDELFDLVLTLDIIEHIEDDLSSIKEFHRVLKPEGLLIVTVPAFQFLWTSHDLAVHHKRRYTRSELIDILRIGGFRIEKATYWNFFLFLPVAMIRLFKKLCGPRDTNQTDLVELSAPLNGILYGLLRFENAILGLFDLPFGVSIICICRKI